MGEDTDNLVESTSQLQALVKGMTGFDIMKDKDTFKDIYDIVVGIGEKWDSLSDVNQAALLEALAGKTQANAFAAALTNIDTLKKAYSEAMNSTGSAEAEQENFAKGMQYHLNKLSVAWEDFSHTIVNSDVAKVFIDTNTGALNLLNTLHKITGIGPTLATIFSYKTVANNGGLNSIYSRFKARKDDISLAGAEIGLKTNDKGRASFINSLQTINSINNSPSLDNGGINELKGAVADYNKALESGTADVNTFLKAHKDLNATTQQTIKNLSGTKISIEAATAEYERISGVAFNAGKTISNLGSKVLDVAKGIGISFAIGTAINLIAKAWSAFQDYLNRAEIANKKIDELKSATKNAKDDLQALNDEIANNQEAIDGLKSSAPLTYIEKQQLNDLKEATAELLIQKDILENTVTTAEKEQGEGSIKAYRTEFGSVNYQETHRVGAELYGLDTPTVKDFNDIIEEYNTAKTDLKNARKSLIKGVNDDSNEAVDDTYEATAKTFDEKKKQLETWLSDLSKHYDGAKDYIDKLNKKNPLLLTDEEKLDIEGFNDLVKQRNDILKTLRPDEYKSIQIDKIFDMEGIEATKSQLVELAQQGKLTRDTFKNYGNLFKAITDADLGEDKLGAFIDELNALSKGVKATEAIVSDSMSRAKSSTESTVGTLTAFTSALDEQNKNGYISTETLNKLKENYKDIGDVLVQTNYGVQLNVQKFKALMGLQVEKSLDTINESYIKLSNQYTIETAKLAGLQGAYNNTTDAQVEYRKSLQDQIDTQKQVVDGIVDSISQLDTYSQAINRSRNAYNELQDAMNTTNAGAHYDSMEGIRKTIEEQAQKRMYGTDEMAKYIQYNTNTDVSTFGIKATADAYQKALEFDRKYTTADFTGLNKLVADLKEIGSADGSNGIKVLENGQIKITSLDDAAKSFGTTVAWLEDHLNKMKDYKINIDWETSHSELVDYDQSLIQTKAELEKLKNVVNSDDYNVEVGYEGMSDSEIRNKIAELQSVLDQSNSALKIHTTYDINGAINTIKNLEDQKNTEGLPGYAKRAIEEKQNKLAQEYNLNIEAVVNTKLSTDAIQNLENYSKSLQEIKEKAEEPKKVDIQYDKDTLNGIKAIKNTLSEIAGIPNASLEKKIKVSVVNEGNLNFLDTIVNGGTKKTSTKKQTFTPAPDEGENKSNASGQNNGINTSQSVGANKTLVGEQGRELVVDPNSKSWYTVGEHGSEFVNLPKDAIVYTASQTKQLLSSGKTGRGKSTGKSFASGSPNSNGVNGKDYNPIFGNIDVANRQIQWNDDGSYSTILGSWDEHFANGKIVAAYSPLVQSTDGSNKPILLDDETAWQYVNEIANKSLTSNIDPYALDKMGIVWDSGNFSNVWIHSLIGFVGDATKANIAIASDISQRMHTVGEYWDKRNGRVSGLSSASGKNLVGEQGRELVVDPDNKTWYTVGDNGSELVNLPKNAIVYTAKQTEELLTSGKTGRGESTGKAYADGKNNGSNKHYTGINVGTNAIDTSEFSFLLKSATNKASKALKDNTQAVQANTDRQKDIYTWIDQKFNILDHDITMLNDVATDSEKSISERLTAYKQIQEKQKEKLSSSLTAEQTRADTWNEALKKLAAKVGMTDAVKFMNKVLSGDVTKEGWKDEILGPETSSSSSSTGKKGKSQAEKAASDAEKKKWEEEKTARKEVLDAYNELIKQQEYSVKTQQEIEETVKAQYNLQISAVDAIISGIESSISGIQTKIEIDTTVGNIVQAKDYQKLIGESQDKADALEDKLNILNDELGEFDEGSETYNSILQEISSVEQALQGVKKQQAEWNEEIKALPIKHIRSYIENLKAITTNLSDYASEVEARGNYITASVINKQVELQRLIADQFVAQADLLSDRMRTYVKGSDKWNSDFKDLRSLSSELSNVVKQMIEYNKQILAIPVNKISDANAELEKTKSALNDLQNDNLTIINQAISIIERNADKLTKPLSDQLALLQKQNDQYSRQVAIEQARYNLQKALEQKTVQVVRNGKLVYESDADSVRDAQNSLREAEYNDKVGKLQDQIDKINKDAEDQKEKWQKIQTDAEYENGLKNAAELANTTADRLEKDIASGQDKDLYDATKKSYDDTAEQLNVNEKMSQDLSRVVTLLQDINDAFIKGNINATQLKQLSDGVVESAKNGFTGSEELANRLRQQGVSNANEVTDKAKDVLDGSKAAIDESSKIAEQTNGILENYSKKLEEVSNEVIKELEDARQAYSNAKAAEALGGNKYDYYGGNGSGGASRSNGSDLSYRMYLAAVASGEDVSKAKTYDGVGNYNEHYYNNGMKITTGQDGNIYVTAANGTEYVLNTKTISKYGYNTDYTKNGKWSAEKANEITINAQTQYNNIYNYSNPDEQRNASMGGSSSSSSGTYNGRGADNHAYYNGKDYGSIVTHKVTTRADGLAGGIIKDSNENQKLIQQLGLKPMDGDRVLAMLKPGELVTNEAQQKRTINNLRNLTSNFVGYPNGVTNRNIEQRINITMGDIQLPNVKQPDEFAEALLRQFEPSINQQWSKIFKH